MRACQFREFTFSTHQRTVTLFWAEHGRAQQVSTDLWSLRGSLPSAKKESQNWIASSDASDASDSVQKHDANNALAAPNHLNVEILKSNISLIYFVSVTMQSAQIPRTPPLSLSLPFAPAFSTTILKNLLGSYPHNVDTGHNSITLASSHLSATTRTRYSRKASRYYLSTL